LLKKELKELFLFAKKNFSRFVKQTKSTEKSPQHRKLENPPK
jgi:hypothetical protein